MLEAIESEAVTDRERLDQIEQEWNLRDGSFAPEREQEIRDLDTRFCQYNAGCSCCSFRLPLLGEIDRLRADLAAAREALAFYAARPDEHDNKAAREALHRISATGRDT